LSDDGLGGEAMEQQDIEGLAEAIVERLKRVTVR
jgi:hypothetical protein